MEVKNIIMYLRKSRADENGQQICEVLAKHEKQLQDYALHEFGNEIPQKNIYREVVSGETIEDRPVMKEVMHILESQLIEGVLVIEPQRLSRGDLLECGRVINAFRYTRTLILTPVKIYNLSEEYDRRFFEMELMRGNDYLEYSKRIMNRGRVASVNQGNYIASVRPFGYKKIIVGKGKNKFHTLEIIPHEAEIVMLIYKLYTERGIGFSKIAKILDNMDVKPIKSDRWSPYSISAILSNPIYIGQIRWNARRTVKVWKNEKIIKTRPINNDESDIILVPGKHTPIIDEKTFYKARERRGSMTREKSNKSLKNPFAGIMYCGKCGAAMIMKSYVDKRSSNPHKSTYILCSHQTRCHSKSVNYNDVMIKVQYFLQNYFDDFEIDINYYSEKNNNVKQNAKIKWKECIEMLDDENIDASAKNNFLKGFIKQIKYYDCIKPASESDSPKKNTYTLEIYLK